LGEYSFLTLALDEADSVHACLFIAGTLEPKSLSGLCGLERSDKITEGLTLTIDTEIRG